VQGIGDSDLGVEAGSESDGRHGMENGSALEQDGADAKNG